MSDLKDLSHRLYKEVFENRDVDALDHLATEDMRDHEGMPGVDLPPGRDGVKQALQMWLDAFQPMTVNIRQQFQDGDTVINLVTFRGTHSGEFMGIEPTGKRFEIEAIDVLRFEGDRIAEHWGRSDDLGMMEQLGLLPAMG